MDDAFDLPSEQDEAAIQRLMRSAQNLIDQQNLVEDLEKNLSDAKKVLQRIKTVDIPDLMAECGLSEFRHAATGARVRVEDFVSGSLPKDPVKRAAAIEALIEMGAVDLIKTEIEITFERRQHNEAVALAEDLRARGLNVEVTSGVHPQTLMADARRRLANGDQLPLETLGLYAGRVAKVESK